MIWVLLCVRQLVVLCCPANCLMWILRPFTYLVVLLTVHVIYVIQTSHFIAQIHGDCIYVSSLLLVRLPLWLLNLLYLVQQTLVHLLSFLVILKVNQLSPSNTSLVEIYLLLVSWVSVSFQPCSPSALHFHAVCSGFPLCYIQGISPSSLFHHEFIQL